MSTTVWYSSPVSRVAVLVRLSRRVQKKECSVLAGTPLVLSTSHALPVGAQVTTRIFRFLSTCRSLESKTDLPVPAKPPSVVWKIPSSILDTTPSSTARCSCVNSTTKTPTPLRHRGTGIPSARKPPRGGPNHGPVPDAIPE
jgi:hypothetical protein